MMTQTMLDDYGMMQDRLARLRQAIIRAEPAVLTDGRFEEMFVAPLNVIDIARQLIETLPPERRQ